MGYQKKLKTKYARVLCKTWSERQWYIDQKRVQILHPAQYHKVGTASYLSLTHALPNNTLASARLLPFSVSDTEVHQINRYCAQLCVMCMLTKEWK